MKEEFDPDSIRLFRDLWRGLLDPCALRLVDPWKPISESQAHIYLVRAQEVLEKATQGQTELLHSRYRYDRHAGRFGSAFFRPRTRAECACFDADLSFYQCLEEAVQYIRNIRVTADARHCHIEAAATANRSLALRLAIGYIKGRITRELLYALRTDPALVPREYDPTVSYAFLAGWLAARIRRYAKLERALRCAHPGLSFEEGLLMELPAEAVLLADPFLRGEIPFEELPNAAARQIQQRHHVSALEVLTDVFPPPASRIDPVAEVLDRGEIQAFVQGLAPQQREIVRLVAEERAYTEIAAALVTTEQTVKQQLKRVRLRAKTFRAQLH